MIFSHTQTPTNKGLQPILTFEKFHVLKYAKRLKMN